MCPDGVVLVTGANYCLFWDERVIFYFFSFLKALWKVNLILSARFCLSTSFKRKMPKLISRTGPFVSIDIMVLCVCVFPHWYGMHAVYCDNPKPLKVIVLGEECFLNVLSSRVIWTVSEVGEHTLHLLSSARRVFVFADEHRQNAKGFVHIIEVWKASRVSQRFLLKYVTKTPYVFPVPSVFCALCNISQ